LRRVNSNCGKFGDFFFFADVRVRLAVNSSNIKDSLIFIGKFLIITGKIIRLSIIVLIEMNNMDQFA